jgi:hypothetical protein
MMLLSLKHCKRCDANHLFRRSVVGSGSGGSSGARLKTALLRQERKHLLTFTLRPHFQTGFLFKPAPSIDPQQYGLAVPAKGYLRAIRHPVIKFKKVNEENRNSDR